MLVGEQVRFVVWDWSSLCSNLRWVARHCDHCDVMCVFVSKHCYLLFLVIHTVLWRRPSIHSTRDLNMTSFTAQHATGAPAGYHGSVTARDIRWWYIAIRRSLGPQSLIRARRGWIELVLRSVTVVHHDPQTVYHQHTACVTVREIPALTHNRCTVRRTDATQALLASVALSCCCNNLTPSHRITSNHQRDL